MKLDLILWQINFFKVTHTWDFYGKCDENLYYNESDEDSHSTGSRDEIDDDDVFDPCEMLRFREWDNINSNHEPSRFHGLKNNAGVPLYLGNTKHTQLSFVSKLLHFKISHGCSERGFTELLGLIGDVLPEDHKLLPSHREI